MIDSRQNSKLGSFPAPTSFRISGDKMRTTIYYFSGTGNTLAIAKRLAGELGDCELKSIANAMRSEDYICTSEIIGFMCPVYYICAPQIVLDFASKIEMPNKKYGFFALTRGLFIAHGAASQVNKILKGRGLGFESAWYFTMDQNYLPYHTVKSEEKRERIFARAYKRVSKVAEAIKRQKKHFELNHSDICNRFTYETFLADVRNRDREFYLSDDCTGCGICEKVCPVNNIRMVDGKPAWQHKCEMCYGCVHFCPKKAIQSRGGPGDKHQTEGKKRATHPEVSVKDMIVQSHGG